MSFETHAILPSYIARRVERIRTCVARGVERIRAWRAPARCQCPPSPHHRFHAQHRRTSNRSLITSTSFAILCLVPAVRVALSQDPPQNTRSAGQVTSEQIQQWIAELKSDNYSARESASRKISRHLDEALQLVVKAAEEENELGGEPLLQFLGFVGQNALSAEGRLAFDTLKKIAEERTTNRAVVAQKILENISIQMRELAMDRLKRAGVSCEDRYLSVLTRMKEIKSALVIDQRFTGTASDLELLPWLFDVQFVKLEGPAITREVLALVAKMPKLNSLQIIETSLQSADIECLTDAPDLELLEILYTPIDDSSIDILERLPVFGDLQLFGTRLTAKGAIEVVDRIDTANVFVGRGGFLGITCEPSSLIIREVIPDGPAQLAGIRTLDKLVSVDGVAISNFEELRRELAKSASGEKVMVEYERPMVSFRRDPTSDTPGTRQVEYTPFRVEVTLGRRPSDVPR